MDVAKMGKAEFLGKKEAWTKTLFCLVLAFPAWGDVFLFHLEEWILTSADCLLDIRLPCWKGMVTVEICIMQHLSSQLIRNNPLLIMQLLPMLLSWPKHTDTSTHFQFNSTFCRQMSVFSILFWLTPNEFTCLCVYVEKELKKTILLILRRRMSVLKQLNALEQTSCIFLQFLHLLYLNIPKALSWFAMLSNDYRPELNSRKVWKMQTLYDVNIPGALFS